MSLELKHWQETAPVRLTISSKIDNNGGAVTLLGNTAGILQMDVVGHDLGDFTINGAYTRTYQTILKLGIDNPLAITKNLTLTKGTFDLAGFNQTVNALSGFLNASLITNSGSTASTLTIGNGGGTGTYSGVIADGTAAISLVKTGSGTQTLAGTNTYSGDTTVRGGTLAVTGGKAIKDSGKLVIHNGGKVDSGTTETVGTLFFGVDQQIAGTWGSTTSTATNKNDTYFTGSGVVQATSDPSYAVTYHANEATSGIAPAAQTKTHGVALTLATNTGALERTGYIFAGWNIAANGSGTQYDFGATYAANATLTLYAKWNAVLTWTQNSVATQMWTTPGNWATSKVYVSDAANELKFFSDITTALVSGINNITASVPTSLSMNILTLNGKGAAATENSIVNIASNSSSWTLGGTTPTVNLNGVEGSVGSPLRQLIYDVKAKLSLAQANTLFTGNGTASFLFSGLISATSSSNAITKSGTSTLTLTNNANSFSGDVIVNTGILDAHRGSLGTGAGKTYINSTGAIITGGQLFLNSNGERYDESENVVIQGTGNNASGAGTAALRFGGIAGTVCNMNGSITLDGNVNYKIDVYLQPTHWRINGGITRSGTNTGILFLDLSHGQQTTPVRLTINSAIDNNGGPVTLLGNTAGILQMDVAGHDLGDFTINGSITPTWQPTLKLGISDALATAKNLTLTSGIFDLAGFNQTVNALGAVLNNSLVTNSEATVATLTVGNGNGTSTYSGKISNGMGPIFIIKQGTGTQTLAGPVSYSGNTTVSGGMLVFKQVNPSNDSSSVSIAAGAKLGLDFVGTDAVAKLFLGTPAVQVPAGTYNASHPTYGGYFRFGGSLVVSTGSTLTSGFSAWITRSFKGGATVPLAQQEPNHDPDGDGISNLVEYAISDQDPTVPNAAVGTFNGKTLSFNKRQPLASDILYVIETSPNLLPPWTARVTHTALGNTDATISYTLPADHGEVFARLKITE